MSSRGLTIVLSVRRAYHYVNGREVTSEPKSARGSRQVALTGRTVEVLLEHRSRSESEAMMLGCPLRPDDFLFRTIEHRRLTC